MFEIMATTTRDVRALLSHEVIVLAQFDNNTVFQDSNAVCVADSRQTVRHNNGGAAHAHAASQISRVTISHPPNKQKKDEWHTPPIECLMDQSFVLRVEGRGGLV